MLWHVIEFLINVFICRMYNTVVQIDFHIVTLLSNSHSETGSLFVLVFL